MKTEEQILMLLKASPPITGLHPRNSWKGNPKLTEINVYHLVNGAS